MTIILDRPRATDTETPVTNLGHVGVTPYVHPRYINIGEQSSTSLVRPIADPIRRAFHDLADWWHEATDAWSSPDEKVDHDAYQRIIRLGKPVLPYILEDLRDYGGHWFMALEEINQVGPPIPHGVIPSLRAEREAWLSWGKSSGILD